MISMRGDEIVHWCGDGGGSTLRPISNMLFFFRERGREDGLRHIGWTEQADTGV